MSRKIFLYFLFLFLVLTVFGYFIFFKRLDPDFGWHLRTGELILEKGPPQTDWYSFTMPDFPWIAHSWLTDIFIYKIYSILGFQALLLIFLGISALSFIILIKPKDLLFYLLPVILGFCSILGFLGIRPQIITIFFTVVLWKVLTDFLENRSFSRRSIFCIPILFFIWVNLHGGFFVGLLILFLLLILEIFKKTSSFRKLTNLPFFQDQNIREQPAKKILIIFLVSILSFLATLLNPYGIRIYEEIFFRTSSDNFLRFHIAEWLPLFFNDSIFIILYLALFLGLLIFFRKRIEFSSLILILVFLIFALLNQRHFFIFVVLTIPVFARLIFYLKGAGLSEGLSILFSGYKKLIAISILLIILAFGFYPIFIYAFKTDITSSYPQQALPFLRTLPLSENLFNEYDWGGYLIWQIPQRKLFIDGRMPSWRKDGRFVFGDYLKIKEAKENFEELLDKYDIKIVLLKNKKIEKNEKIITENRLLNFLKKQNWLLKILGLEPKKNLTEELINLGWQVIYQDETTIILRTQQQI